MSVRDRNRRPRSSPGDAECYFHAALSWSVSDDAARLLFAEWLEECGDWRAEGYRWMAERRKEPSLTTRTCDWWHERSTNRREIVLPDLIWNMLDAPPHEGFPTCKEFPSLPEAEAALCEVIRALSKRP